jgi:hypothetical protein
MANQSSDRQRMRNDLRELAKLAAPVAAAPHHGFEDADSSGYVDLSAFSAKDPRWVDRELARARTGGPPPLPPPPPRAAAIGVHTPASMAPVALESLLTPDETASVRPSRTKRVFYGLAALASVGLVGFLAVALARHPPPPVAAEPSAIPAAAPDTATAAPAAPSPAASTTVASVATPPATNSASAASPAPKGSKARHAATHAVARPATAPAAAPARAVAARPVSIPASPSGGGNSLMDLIKQSVAKGK